MVERGHRSSLLDADELDKLPGTVWVPVQLPRFGGSVPQLETRETTSGHLALPVYSSLEMLQARHGAHGHAVTVPSAELDWLRRYAGFQAVSLDPYIPVELRSPDGDDGETEWPEATEPPPDVVWLPCRPVVNGDSEVTVEMHPNDDGELVLPAFTSTELLRACCGPYQAATAYRVDDLADIAAGAGADAVEFNPTLRSEARHTAPQSGNA